MLVAQTCTAYILPSPRKGVREAPTCPIMHTIDQEEVAWHFIVQGCLATLVWVHTFLAAVVTARSITAYKGNYDVFVKTAAERLRNAQKAAEAQAAKRAHVQVQIMVALGLCACSLRNRQPAGCEVFCSTGYHEPAVPQQLKTKAAQLCVSGT